MGNKINEETVKRIFSAEKELCAAIQCGGKEGLVTEIKIIKDQFACDYPYITIKQRLQRSDFISS